MADFHEVFLLMCPICGGQMRLFVFIADGVQSKNGLDHIVVGSQPQHISPACGPPLWDASSDAQKGDGAQIEPDWDLAEQPAPDYEVDRQVSL